MKLGNRELALPLIQGGMGVGVSMGGLAGAVAAEEAMGTLSTADAGWNEPDFAAHPQQANLRALRREVQRAKRLAAGAGLVAVNAMVATRQYADSVRTALEAGADAIVSGAGLPLELPALAEGFEALLAPIVSGPRAAQLICRELFQAGHTELTTELLEPDEIPSFPQARRELRSATVSSLRLDAVLAAMLRCSRGQACELIAAGRVEINHLPAEKPHAPVYEGDVFTVRGKGRFGLTALPGKSKKDRSIIEFFQY